MRIINIHYTVSFDESYKVSVSLRRSHYYCLHYSSLVWRNILTRSHDQIMACWTSVCLRFKRL